MLSPLNSYGTDGSLFAPCNGAAEYVEDSFIATSEYMPKQAVVTGSIAGEDTVLITGPTADESSIIVKSTAAAPVEEGVGSPDPELHLHSPKGAFACESAGQPHKEVDGDLGLARDSSLPTMPTTQTSGIASGSREFTKEARATAAANAALAALRGLVMPVMAPKAERRSAGGGCLAEISNHASFMMLFEPP